MQADVIRDILEKRDRAAVMAIINITPDSFYGASRTFDRESISQRISCAVDCGADILDFGGYSTRPMAEEVEQGEEIRRLSLAMDAVAHREDVVVSIDTFRPSVVEALYRQYGPFIVNDISGGDEQMFSLVAELGLPYVCTHMRGVPQTMQTMTDYENVVEEVGQFFERRVELLRGYGVEQIILDPGFGFAKTIEQNYKLLEELNAFKRFNLPLLVGLSRKSMIYKPLQQGPDEVLAATTALHWEALRNGADILRVHDVAEAVQCATLYHKYKQMTI